MATYSQNATVTFGGVPLSEVTRYDFRIDTAAPVFKRGELQIFSLSPFPASLWAPGGSLESLRKDRTLQISHQGTLVFRGRCRLFNYSVEATRNNVVEYVMTFRVLYIE